MAGYLADIYGSDTMQWRYDQRMMKGSGENVS